MAKIVDENLVVKAKVEREGVKWYSVREKPFLLSGLYRPEDGGEFRRVPRSVTSEISEEVEELACDTAGGRVRFATNSSFVAIRMHLYLVSYNFPHMALTGKQGADLYRMKADGIGSEYVDTYRPPVDEGLTAFEGIVETHSNRLATYTLNLPLYGTVADLWIGLDENATLTEGAPYRNDVPVVYYGSSITQGGCASRPGTCYEGKISMRHNLEYKNFGFSGNARARAPMLGFLTEQKMSAFVCDYDHNAPTAEYLRDTLPTVYRTVRSVYPDIPYIFVSAPGHRMGPERRGIVEDNYKRAVAAGDKNVYFVDGYNMFPGIILEDWAVDGCHPNDLGFEYMYRAIAPVLLGALGYHDLEENA